MPISMRIVTQSWWCWTHSKDWNVFFGKDGHQKVRKSSPYRARDDWTWDVESSNSVVSSAPSIVNKAPAATVPVQECVTKFVSSSLARTAMWQSWFSPHCPSSGRWNPLSPSQIWFHFPWIISSTANATNVLSSLSDKRQTKLSNKP